LRFAFEVHSAPSRVQTLFRQGPLFVGHQRFLAGLCLVNCRWRRRWWRRWRLLCLRARDRRANHEHCQEEEPLHR
jgi:hypothetical protein